MPIQAIFFDFDGTLIDSESKTGRTVAETTAAFGLGRLSLPETQTVGRTFADIAESLHRSQGPFQPGVLARLPAAMRRRFHVLVARAPAMPGARRAVAAAARRFPLAVVSSSLTYFLHRHLNRLGMATFVKPALRIGADKVARHKPHPEGYLLAASLCGVRPADCLVLEDSPAGMKAARAAGMKVVAFGAGVRAGRGLAHGFCPDFRRVPAAAWQMPESFFLGRA
jgi:HAD superfamily hydrolase (TIGR01509 family)